MTHRVLVTGGSGFIGTNLVSRLLDDEMQVLNLDISPPRQARHEFVWTKVDLLDRDGLVDAFTSFAPHTVFHLAARTDLLGSSLRDYEANTAGVENVLSAVRACSTVQRAIFASSRMVCKIGVNPASMTEYSPPNSYGESKVIGERLVRAAELSCAWTIVRPTSIWGPWFEIPYKTFFLSIARGRYLHPAGRDVWKSFGFVGNTVHQLLALAADTRATLGETLYLGDYPPINVLQMAEEIRTQLGAPPVRSVPVPVLRAAAAAGDLASHLGWQHPPLTSFRLSNLMTDMRMDLTPLQAVVGPLPYSMEDGVRVTSEWLRETGQV